MDPNAPSHSGKTGLVIADIEFIKIPAGSFIMGSLHGGRWTRAWEEPQHTLDLPEFWMAKFPLTNGQYAIYVKAVGDGVHPGILWRLKENENHPVVDVSWLDAENYCEWFNAAHTGELPAGLRCRLPTEAEWEKTARGENGREWPWGSEFDPTRCNGYESGGYETSVRRTTPVGQYSPFGDSPYGCADMAGNVWEWMHSLFKDYPYSSNDGREDLKAADPRVMRGGSCDSRRDDVRGACREKAIPGYFNSDLGFRLVLSSITY